MIEIREALGKLESLIHVLEITPILGERRDKVWKATLEAIVGGDSDHRAGDGAHVVARGWARMMLECPLEACWGLR
jgi:hypothetical protein